MADESSEEQNDDNITVADPYENHNFDDLNVDQSPTLHNKALFLLKLKEERRVSQRAINGIVDDMNTLFEEELATLKAEVISCFSSSQNTAETMKKAKHVFEQKSSVPFFHHLGSEHFQKAYYTTHFHFVVSYGYATITSQHSQLHSILT